MPLFGRAKSKTVDETIEEYRRKVSSYVEAYDAEITEQQLDDIYVELKKIQKPTESFCLSIILKILLTINKSIELDFSNFDKRKEIKGEVKEKFDDQLASKKIDIDTFTNHLAQVCINTKFGLDDPAIGFLQLTGNAKEQILKDLNDVSLGMQYTTLPNEKETLKNFCELGIWLELTWRSVMNRSKWEIGLAEPAALAAKGLSKEQLIEIYKDTADAIRKKIRNALLGLVETIEPLRSKEPEELDDTDDEYHDANSDPKTVSIEFISSIKIEDKGEDLAPKQEVAHHKSASSLQHPALVSLSESSAPKQLMLQTGASSQFSMTASMHLLLPPPAKKPPLTSRVFEWSESEKPTNATCFYELIFELGRSELNEDQLKLIKGKEIDVIKIFVDYQSVWFTKNFRPNVTMFGYGGRAHTATAIKKLTMIDHYLQKNEVEYHAFRIQHAELLKQAKALIEKLKNYYKLSEEDVEGIQINNPLFFINLAYDVWNQLRYDDHSEMHEKMEKFLEEIYTLLKRQVMSKEEKVTVTAPLYR